MNNNQAREYFKRAVLKYETLTQRDIVVLRNMINSEFRAENYMDYDLIKCLPKIDIKMKASGFIDCAFIYCKADNFDKREAVSFNTDGFIGFAGWASSNNTAPILEAFVKWVRIIKQQNNRAV